MKEDLEITEEQVGGALKLHVKGRIDATSADTLDLKLQNILGDGQINIILNMSKIEYLSSVGIRIILKTYKKASEAGGKFNVERPSEIVKNVLGMTALDSMLIN